MQNVENEVLCGVKHHPRSPAMSLFDRAHTTSYSTLIETMCLSCMVFWSYSKLFVKDTKFNLSHLHLAPLLGMTWFKFHADLWYQTTRVPGLSCGGVCMILLLAMLTQYWCVKDRHTHTHKDTHTNTMTACTTLHVA